MIALNYKKRKYSKIMIAVLIAILFLLVLNVFSQRIRNFFYFISSPFQKLLWQTGQKSSALVEPFLTASVIKTENSELAIKNQELLSEVSLLNELKAENQALRQALDAGLEKEFKFIAAEIISKDVSADSILIDKGFGDGISKDMPVINQQKVLFGKVAEVYRNFSKINLISDKNFASDVKIQNKETYGIAKGASHLGLYLELVPWDADFKNGDVVLTSSLAGFYPKNLLIGNVSNIVKEDTKSFQTARIEPFFDLKSADTLLVITNFKN